MSNSPTSWTTAAVSFNNTLVNQGSTIATSSSTANIQPWTTPWITTPGINPYNNGTVTIPINNGTWTQQEPINPLSDLNYSIDFDIDEDEKELLEDNIKGIKKNKFIFSCRYEGNRIQPYELIMKLIREKTKFTVTVDVSDVLSIKYTNVQFVKIENNLNFDINCDFSELKVKFKYENIKHQNHKLSLKEVRMDKLKKLKEIEE